MAWSMDGYSTEEMSTHLQMSKDEIRQIQPLLDRAGYTIVLTQKRLYSASGLTAYALSTGAFS